MKQEQYKLNLTLPASADFIDLARLTLYGVANKMGFSYEDIEDMKVAVAEACNNVVVHAYPEGVEGTIELTFEMDDHSLSIHVSDNGLSFAFEERTSDEPPHTGKALEDISVGGLGIYLMQALMDEVKVTGDKGTRVTLVKHLYASSASK